MGTKIFLNITHFHGWQPFGPILWPGKKMHLPVTFLKKIFAENLPTNARSNIYQIQSAILPYFQNIQNSSFLIFDTIGSLKLLLRLIFYRKPYFMSNSESKNIEILKLSSFLDHFSSIFGHIVSLD